MITNTTQRQKAQHIYDTYFNPDSELSIDFDLLDTLSFYSATTEKQAKKLTKKLDNIGNELFKSMEIYDRKLIGNS